MKNELFKRTFIYSALLFSITFFAACSKDSSQESVQAVPARENKSQTIPLAPIDFSCGLNNTEATSSEGRIRKVQYVTFAVTTSMLSSKLDSIKPPDTYGFSWWQYEIPLEVVVKTRDGNIKKVLGVRIDVWKDGAVKVRQPEAMDFRTDSNYGVVLEFLDNEAFENSRANEILSCKIMP